MHGVGGSLNLSFDFEFQQLTGTVQSGFGPHSGRNLKRSLFFFRGLVGGYTMGGIEVREVRSSVLR